MDGGVVVVGFGVGAMKALYNGELDMSLFLFNNLVNVLYCLLSATLKTVFMLWEEQKPPTLLWIFLVLEVEMK